MNRTYCNHKVNLKLLTVFSEDQFSTFNKARDGKFFSLTMEVLKRNKKTSKMSPGKRRWLKAVKLVKDRGDPWQKFNLGKIKSEAGRRHRW